MKVKLLSLCGLLAVAFAACDDPKDNLIKDPVTDLSVDCIKRSLPTMPNIVGQPIEFVCAAAIPTQLGRVTSGEVVASIEGADNTYIDQNSYHTNTGGADVPVKIATSASVNAGGKTTLNIDVDTCAVALRYNYYPTAAAKGKKVQFTFTAKASNGSVATADLGSYLVSAMDMTKGVSLEKGTKCYISVHDADAAIKVVNSAAEADLVYNYDAKADLTHGFFAGDAPTNLCPGVDLSGVAATRIKEAGNLRDRQLADLKYDNVVDALDLQQIDVTKGGQAYCIKLGAEYGFWYQTADGKYKGYVYVNSISANKITVSAKRLAM